jgi:hypothetical protein
MNTMKKTKKNLDKNNIFHYEPISMMVFHNHMKEVRSLEKSGFHFYSLSKITLC